MSARLPIEDGVDRGVVFTQAGHVCRFVVPGVVVAKGRPRFTTAGLHPRAYTPKKTAIYEAHVRFAAHEAMKGQAPFAGPVFMRVVCSRPVLKSMSKTKASEAIAGMVLPTTKPDLNNYVKLAEDAMNGVVFVDDSQVVECVAIKRFGERAELAIEVRELVT